MNIQQAHATARQEVRENAAKTALLNALKAAKKAVEAPMTYSKNQPTNDAFTKRAKDTYGNFIGVALADLESIGFITPYAISLLEKAFPFPVNDIPKMMEKTGETMDTTRIALQISHSKFVNAVGPLMDKIKAPSPTSAPGHHPAGM